MFSEYNNYPLPIKGLLGIMEQTGRNKYLLYTLYLKYLDHNSLRMHNSRKKLHTHHLEGHWKFGNS